MPLRPTLLRALLASALVALAGAVPAVQAAQPPLEINAILSLTGPIAFLGQTEAEVLQSVEELTNRTGGVRGRPIHFAIGDDQTNPQVGIQLATPLIAKNVPVILGPSIASTCNAIIPLVAKAGPNLYCLTPAIKVTPGGYVFSSTVTSAVTTGIGVRYFRERGFKRMALLATIDATGQDLEASIVAAFTLPENAGVQLVAREHYSPADINIAAQISRIKAANPDALLTAASGAPFGTLLRALHDAGLNLPVYAASSNMTYTAMQQYAAFLPGDLSFSGLLGQMPGVVFSGRVRNAQTVFFDTMRARKAPITAGHQVTWDVAMMIVDAYRKFGPELTAEQLHGWIEGLHGYPGINGFYDFRDGSQRGLREDSVVVYRWDAARGDFAPASKPAGRLR